MVFITVIAVESHSDTLTDQILNWLIQWAKPADQLQVVVGLDLSIVQETHAEGWSMY